MKNKSPKLLYSDKTGNIYSHQSLHAVGFTPYKFSKPKPECWIEIPEGTKLFYIPDFPAIGYDSEKKTPEYLYKLPHDEREPCFTVSAFLPPGYIRIYLSHFGRASEKPLPMWAYTACGEMDGKLFAAAFKIEDNPKWYPENYDDRDLLRNIEQFETKYKDNRLFRHLANCATDYHCFAAKNLFLKRWEAPIPTSPACNSNCLGCLSFQSAQSGFPASHERIKFVPEVSEITELMLPHLENADDAIVSFGQGCEGEPLLQSDLLIETTRILREKTSRGTINLNTNGSKPEVIDNLAKAGLDSIRISLNSARKKLYDTYYKPMNYSFRDVRETIKRSVDAGLFTMINYLIFPGITDTKMELDELTALLKETKVNMIHMKNLNIDPDYYFNMLEPDYEKPFGMKHFVLNLNKEFPSLFIGYFNQPKEIYKNLLSSPLILDI
ncbi:MAG: radical SAM protein [Candidatus Coatesbacteria bacterium]|nr:radical SAM protein [Candidatus Coatesbacteria bacterium]